MGTKSALDALLTLTDRNEILRAIGDRNIETLRDREHNEGILLNAIRCRNHTLIKLLIQKRTQINARGLYGVTPLMLANLEAAKLLIASGATVDDVDSEGRSALIHALEAADFDKVAYLVAHGADTQLRDSSGLTAADYADSYGFSIACLK